VAARREHIPGRPKAKALGYQPGFSLPGNTRAKARAYLRSNDIKDKCRTEVRWYLKNNDKDNGKGELRGSLHDASR
jgi:hypothetical protein